jgi:hypothetical protein
LKLNVNEKEQTKTVTLELTREELDKLISTLEEVNSVRIEVAESQRNLDSHNTSFYVIVSGLLDLVPAKADSFFASLYLVL